MCKEMYVSEKSIQECIFKGILLEEMCTLGKIEYGNVLRIFVHT